MLGVAACGLSQLLLQSRAEASLFRALSLADLSQLSELILVATPLEASSHWETLGGRRRIGRHLGQMLDALTLALVAHFHPLDDFRGRVLV